MCDADLIPHTQVIADLQADTINTNVCLGVRGKRFAVSLLGELALLDIQVHPSYKFEHSRVFSWQV